MAGILNRLSLVSLFSHFSFSFTRYLGTVINMNSNEFSSTNSWCISIDKLMLWRNSWTKYDRNISNLFLRVHCDQLLFTAGSKILESFNLRHKIKGIYKDDVLILIVNNNNNEIRKIKFQIKSNIAQCIEALSNRFPVVNYNATQSYITINPKYRNIDDVLKYAVDRRENSVGASNLPTDFENFVKICLLDPSFPEIISETERVLNNVVIKK